jgi:two-component system chemotaxis response regulator CheY
MAMSKIMIVDDAAFMRAMLKQIVVRMGHEVAAEAASGEEAVRLYPAVSPDLVTMDITMPDMDGIQALKRIRMLDPKATVIMCSAMAQQKLVIEAITSGAKDFISKPFHEDKVQEAINKALKASSGLT